ncbi:MAG TPA: VWA domain-containing protein [Thermoanaerobaculia bacterium]|nr:VWA domain-containing protein [Thermoanaerobaculia bacterium]
MNRRLALAVALLFVTTSLFGQTTLEWIVLSAAKERAASEKKLILVFRADEACAGCTRLMEEAAKNAMVQRLASDFVFAKAAAPMSIRTFAAPGVSPRSLQSVRAPTARERPATVGLLDARGEEVLTWTVKGGRGSGVMNLGTFIDVMQRANAVAPFIRKADQEREVGREVESHLVLAHGFRQAKELDHAIHEYDEAIGAAKKKGDREASQSAMILRELTVASRSKNGSLDLKRSIGVLHGIVRAPETKKTEAEAWLALGQLYRAGEQPREALDALEHAARLSFASPEVRAATTLLLASSDARLVGGSANIALLLPERAAYSGVLVAQALARSPAIASVEFLLDGQRVANDQEPPFDAKVDVGAVPRRHELRIVARNASGESIGEDGVVLNDRHDEFTVRLALASNRTVNASVDLPAGGTLQALEIFLDDQRIATLTKPPFTTKVGNTSEGSVLRASALLSDGRIAEDVLLVGSGSELIEVHEVELFATVDDEQGELIPNLTRDAFTIREEGKPRPIVGFEYAEGTPFTVGLTIDSSTSMRSRIAWVHDSARAFLTRITEHGHAAFIVDFDSQPRLAASTTSDARALLAGIDGIRADGATALHDAMVFSLLQLQGVGGKRALIVLTDGRDSGSRYSVDDVARVARETGASVYLLALSTSVPSRLKQVAAETGGRAFELRGTTDLNEVYATIEHELQRQYRLSFRTDAGANDAWRSVEVSVARQNAKVRTASGFVPR